MHNQSLHLSLVRTELDSLFFNGCYETNGRTVKIDPFEVKTYRWGDNVIVSSKGFYTSIPMKDSLIMKLSGNTWESKVRKAQQDAFESAYLNQKEEDIKDYQVQRLNNA